MSVAAGAGGFVLQPPSPRVRAGDGGPESAGLLDSAFEGDVSDQDWDHAFG